MFKPMKIILAVLTAGVVAAIFLGLWSLKWLQTRIPIAESQREFFIEHGESTAQIAQRLADQGVLHWPLIWRLYAYGVEKKTVKAGEYRFAELQSPLAILHQFQRGDVVIHNVTFPEGLTFREWLKILAAEPKLKHELADKTADEQKKLLQFGYDFLEGWFFPDTYHYQAGDSDREILMRAHKKMQQTLEKLWRTRAENLPYNSPSEVLIMASIVEKETGNPAERSAIAGVFVRRLQNNMRLQTDPTVIYGMGELYAGNITLKDLQQPTPYNTYIISGLPPTPIANPGEEAIHAAVHPQPGNSLYFVAKGDGSHEFSATVEQHNQAVERYQRSGRVEQYRSKPQR